MIVENMLEYKYGILKLKINKYKKIVVLIIFVY